MLKLNFIYKVKVNFNEKEAQKTVSEALSKLGIDNVLIEIMFVGEKKMQTLNKEHRKIDKATDVLSFPQTQVSQSKLNILGSIVICPKIAEERDENTLELVKHGVLHLAGFDHETDEKKWGKAADRINCKF